MEANGALFHALRLEKLVTAIFIGLISFVAGLNILVVLSMTVTDKAKDIAVLQRRASKQLDAMQNYARWERCRRRNKAPAEGSRLRNRQSSSIAAKRVRTETAFALLPIFL